MTDFGSSIYKVKPGLKCYLYTSSYGNVVDELLKRSLDSTYVSRLDSDFQQYQLETYMGVGEDTQAIVITDVDQLSFAQWSQIDDLLRVPRIKSLSVYLLGVNPSGEGFDLVKKRVIRQGLYIDAVDPAGTLSQKHLGEWFGDEACVHVQDAEAVCRSLDWNLGLILWTLISYHSISRGNVLSRLDARKILEQISFKSPVTVAFEDIVKKKHTFSFNLSQDQTELLLSDLEQFLFNVSRVSDLMKEQTSDKKVSSLLGIPQADVAFLQSQVIRYPYKTIAKCTKQLKFAKEHITQPELARTVALIWAS